MGTSAWLISRAAQHPPESPWRWPSSACSSSGCRVGSSATASGWSATTPPSGSLADLRVRVYERLEALAPAGLPAFRSGDLLARLVHDVDALQDVMLRVIPPFAIAVVVGAATVGVLWWMLPAAGAVLLVGPAPGRHGGAVADRRLARRTEARQAAARGELAAAVVDLLEGAPDLAAFGATDAQLARIAAADAELTAIASAAARTAGVGIGLTTLLAGLAVWGGLVVGVPAVHGGEPRRGRSWPWSSSSPWPPSSSWSACRPPPRPCSGSRGRGGAGLRRRRRPGRR